MKDKKSSFVSEEEKRIQRDFIDRLYIEFSAMQKRPLAFVETYGCQQNSSDSERIKGMLSDMGFGFCDKPEEAEFILYNTCAVRENAELKVFGNLGALKNIKRKRPEVTIAVCGCMMQQEHIADRIKSKYKHVDLVFGTHALYRFPQLLYNVVGGKRVFDVKNEDGTVCEGINYARDPIPLAKIPIMYGCNNFCTYCIVPYVRGRERSRRSEDIISEVKQVAADGYKEVMLLGQNVNSYAGEAENGEKITFAELLERVCRVDGIERVRFMTSHPKDISDELISVMAREDKICKQLHLPVQCGSDKILGMMNRKYTRDKYLGIVKKVREAMPNIVLTTDIIVGFPGESNEDFEETLSILKEVEYDTIFSFIYSKRVGTPAAEMDDVLTDEEKHINFDRMLEIQNEISKRKNKEYEGTIQKVLVESPSKTNEAVMTGRTEGGKVVNFPGESELIGRVVDVKITSAQTWSLSGEIIRDI